VKDPLPPIDLTGLTTYPLGDRPSKVSIADAGRPWTPGALLGEFFARLPSILAADDLRSAVSAVAEAARHRRMIIFGMGAHVIKVGLNPTVIDLMDRGILGLVAMNGAGIIHDAELALAGKTSEDVGAALGDGSFGMARETAVFLAGAVARAGREQIGLGEAVGREILDAGLPHADFSILAAGARIGIPVTVHVAMGTDILHMHPAFDPAAAGAASHLDFRRFAAAVARLEGGVYLNVGSAVILPEVFLKATSLARNLGHRLDAVTTVNMDFVRHYRPLTNVVGRPTRQGGRGINLVGHHEIMVPLLAAGVIEALGELETGNWKLET
jgi:hypothetical protein